MFEAEQDALDTFHQTTTTTALDAEPLALPRQGSKTGGSRWGILSRKHSSSGPRAAGAAQALAAAEVEELAYFKGECLRQGRELAAVQVSGH